MKKRIDLLVIDPQVDFCFAGTGENDPKRGKLYVDGAEKDMERLADMVGRFGSKIKKIHTTLDCHHLMDVAHPIMWRNSEGQNPDPFTIITAQEMRDGKWTPVLLQYKQKFIDYAEALESGGRYPLSI